VPVEHPFVTAGELTARRKTERRLQLMNLFEAIAIQAETAPTDKLRDAYAKRYRASIGVPPIRRNEFRAALFRRVNVPVEEIIAMHSGD
jgi:hypothetical protein